MIIANPIYDTTFKCLLENNKVAKFLIGTILDCKVLSLEPTAIEYTDEDEETKKISLFRKDFTAIIKTKDEGEKRVIIELQKAKNLGDVFRFTRYLGNEYRKTKHPIIAIYILGFNLSVESPAFTARPGCWDLMTKEKIEKKDAFVEQLTHKAYFIQTKRIKPAYNTRLEKLLAAFEQARFIGDSETTKIFPFDAADDDMKEFLNVLQYVAADEETRKKLERENYQIVELEGIFGEQNAKIAEQAEEIAQLQEAQIITAKTLISFGMSVEQIAQATGLTPDEINKILNQK